MKRRNNKAPKFLLCRLALYAVGAAAGAFGVSGWLETMTWDAIVLAIMTGLSIVVVPVACEVVGVNRWSFLLVPVAVVFGAVNAFSFHHAVDAKIEAPRRAAFEVSTAPLRSKLAAAEQRVIDAQKAKLAIVRTGECIGKNTCARQEARFQADHRLAQEAIDQAKADVAAIVVPKYAPFVDDALVWTVAVAIDIALALALAGITLVRTSIQKQIDARRAAEAAKRAKAAAKVAPKAKPRKRAGVVSPEEQAALIRNMPRQLKLV